MRFIDVNSLLFALFGHVINMDFVTGTSGKRKTRQYLLFIKYKLA